MIERSFLRGDEIVEQFKALLPAKLSQDRIHKMFIPSIFHISLDADHATVVVLKRWAGYDQRSDMEMLRIIIYSTIFKSGSL